jgi:aldose 1-epimerase
MHPGTHHHRNCWQPTVFQCICKTDLKVRKLELAHGIFALAKEWKAIRVQADGRSANVISRLEFWRRPDWMAQFPFAYNLELTCRLMEGALEVETAVENLSSDPMPLSLGYHTYYRIDDSARDDCSIHVPARSQVVVSDNLIPTGEMKPATISDPQPPRGCALDTGFTELARDAAGRAELWVQGKQQKIRISFSPPIRWSCRRPRSRR